MDRHPPLSSPAGTTRERAKMMAGAAAAISPIDRASSKVYPDSRDITEVALLFEPPTHGWLPVRLVAVDSVVGFEASDVPNEPVHELIEALHAALQGQERSVWWHLEPDGYYFELSPDRTDVRLRVSFARDSRQGAARSVLVITGTKREILLPLWRALRRLESFHAQEPHWPPVDFGRLPAIGEALKREE